MTCIYLVSIVVQKRNFLDLILCLLNLKKGLGSIPGKNDLSTLLLSRQVGGHRSTKRTSMYTINFNATQVCSVQTAGLQLTVLAQY